MKRSAALLLVLVASACHHEANVTRNDAILHPRAAVSMRLLADLATLSTGEAVAPARLRQVASAYESDPAALARYVDELLAAPAFSARVSPRMLLGDNLHPSAHPVGRYLLKHAADADVYFLRGPCKASEAVEVSPWWSPERTVRVCPDSYRPDRLHVPDNSALCGGRFTQPNGPGRPDYCGCGPNLAFCMPDAHTQQQVISSLYQETIDTIAYFVGHDRPIEELYTRNESVRDGWAEFVYERALVVNGDLSAPHDPRAWDGAGQLRPRKESRPGEYAGILTTPTLMFALSGERERMNLFSESLWGFPAVSVDVSAETILSLGVLNLRDLEGWKKLASMPVCNHCHARLDYGLQFFHGYPRVEDWFGFLAERQLGGKGPLFLRGIDDPRGEAELTPRGFVELAVKQKEFGDNMVRRVVTWVFASHAEPDDFRAVADAFERTHSLRQMTRVALLRYADRRLHPPGEAVIARVEHGRRPAGAMVAIDAPLRAALDEDCMTCHEEAGALDLRGDQLPRERVTKMLSYVSFGVMPKTTLGLPDRRRRELVGDLLGALWAEDSPAYREASAYFLDGMSAAPIFDASLAIPLVHPTISSTKPWSLLENNVLPDRIQLTPGMAATLGLEALRACKSAHPDRTDLAACMKEASSAAPVMNSVH